MSQNAFSNPMQDWGNHDILFDPNGRKLIEKEFPDIFPVADWPELRETFDYWEQTSKAAKLNTRRYGLLAVLLATLGLVLIALAPLLAVGGNGKGIFAVLGSVALIVGILIGLEHAFRGRHKKRWLEARYWAERTRQLYFQTFAFNLKLASEAINDSESFDAWCEVKRQVLSEFTVNSREKSVFSIKRISTDLASKSWVLLKRWEDQQNAGEFTVNDRLIKLLDKQRFEYQKHYANSQNLAGNVYSKAGLSKKVDVFGDTMTVALVISSAALAIGLLTTGGMEHNAVVWILAIQACIGAVIAAARVVEEGLVWKNDSDRYAWYIENIEVIQARFFKEAPSGKVEALKDLERLSYDELHRFVRAHLDAKFLI